MKKSLFGLLLAVMVAVPVFAKVNMELVPKIGYIFVPKVNINGGGSGKESSFCVGADYYFNVKDNLYVGPGFMWGQKHKVDDDLKCGFTNIYATAKYKIKAGDFKIYPFLQLGCGIAQMKEDYLVDIYYTGGHYREDFSYDGNGGFYWGIGLGAEYKNVIFELLYGCNYGEISYKFSVSESRNYDDGGYESFDEHEGNTKFSYTAFRIQIGYKFAL